ncbi:MAG TPA: T9SS type A sorting domain-containing protein, partial [Chitinophagales bacterium]|nr:T9SS type A sorting domain-containing protein [Chitinophagales bacterium]
VGFITLLQTADGGYILGIDSWSGNTGMKTDTLSGASDFWIIKIDASGNVEWQKAYGSTGADILTFLFITNDGGYFFGGHSDSNSGGAKSENNFGFNDYWVVKIDASGNVIWDNTVGGTDEDQLWNATQTADGGFVLVGASVSGISGEKTEPHVGPYTYTDYWIIKLNNSGTIQWQNTIGGNRIDAALAVFENATGELFINGNSGSIANGDKTEPNYGAANTADYWILKLNATGSIIWQKSIGGSNSDLATATTLCSDGGLIIAGTSFSPASGNKTTNLVGGDDIWIVKLEGGCAFNVELCNELDDNCNGLIDDGAVNTISIAALSGTVFCQGGSAVIEATHSGTGLQWRRNGVNIAGATSSTYTATTSGAYTCFSYSTCDTTESTAVNVTVNKNPKAQITAGGPTTFCTGGSVVLTEAAVAGCTYQWYKGVTPIAGATSLTYTATTSGNYKCRVTKTATGCFKNSNAIAVSVPCKEGLPAGEEGLPDSEAGEMSNGEDAFSIFPNPNHGSFNISGSISSETQIEIFNSLGQLIYTKKVNSLNHFQAAISINNFVTGIYYVRLTNEFTITEQKMIIE